MHQLPETCAIAFKEWAGVCDALGSGRQTLIIRKGGIEEGPSGFVPEYSAFWLYPTFVHEGEQGLKLPTREQSPADPGTVPIGAMVTVESIQRVDDLATLLGLDDLHVWTEETIRKRFAYRKPGVWVLGVRAFRRAEPIPIKLTAAQLGCKSWVPLEQPLMTSGMVPARSDQEAEADRATLAARLGTPTSPTRISPIG
jgi:hypothetical protein